MSARQPRRRLTLGLGRLVTLIAFTVVLTTLGIYQVHEQYRLVEVGYAIDRDLVEYRRLLEAQKRLALKLAAYKDPAAVRAFAEDTLEMRRPGATDELQIPGAGEGPGHPPFIGHVFGVPDPAEGAP